MKIDGELILASPKWVTSHQHCVEVRARRWCSPIPEEMCEPRVKVTELVRHIDPRIDDPIHH